MKQITFTEHTIVALLIAVGTAALMTLAERFFVPSSFVPMGVMGMTGAYLGYLIARSSEATGRIVLGTFWLVASLIAISTLPAIVFIVMQLFFVWIVRSLYYHSGVLAALVDGLLTVVAAGAAIWAAQTGSYFLAIWSLLLVMGCFVWIPQLHRKPQEIASTDVSFNEARHLAEAAMKKLV